MKAKSTPSNLNASPRHRSPSSGVSLPIPVNILAVYCPNCMSSLKNLKQSLQVLLNPLAPIIKRIMDPN